MKKNKIALFIVNPWSLSSLAIALATKCSIVHAAVQVEGVWYDASEQRGTFDKMATHRYQNRNCIVWEFDGDIKPAIQDMVGNKYDWQGVVLWLFKFNQKEKFYCFEAAYQCLQLAGRKLPDRPRLSGCDLQSVLPRSRGVWGEFREFCQ